MDVIPGLVDTYAKVGYGSKYRYFQYKIVVYRRHLAGRKPSTNLEIGRWIVMSVATLLAVEDNLTHQYVLKRFCELFDYDVHVVASGEEAVAAFEMAQYAAILMDLNLPGIDGLECTRQMRAIEQRRRTAKGVPIIAITARDEDTDRHQCLQAGMDDYLSKPFVPEELRKILLRWVYQPTRPNLKILQGGSDELDVIDDFG